ncbi:integrin alpha-PS3-like isoform X2 [Cydia strobilella]|uniref:integrin alpha-PS3-like isoform X2 n=1 Tax=Cydia strobilella TaxID=1100964 RepID=UPI0030059732
MSVNVVLCVLLISLCDGGDVFHEGSKITFHSNNQEDFFGYSVVFGENSNLLVGAPKAIRPGSRHMATGAVFNCSLSDLHTTNITCSPLNLGNEVSARISSTRDFYRDDMWFGASIAVVPTGKLLICAPRWARPYGDRHLLANGACYLQTKRRNIPLYPLGDMKNQAFMTVGSRKEYGQYGMHLNYYAYAQAGMAVKVTGNGSIIIGAPGLLQWTGGIVDYMYSPDVNSVYLSKKPTTNPFYTPDVGPDDYLGKSVESGIFEDGGRILYVAGAPRAKLGFGQVLVFEPASREADPLRIRAKIEGPQLGAYFGASLTCLDINADGRTDILVGAPNFVGKGENVYDQGAVYIYLNKEEATGFIVDYAGHVTGSSTNGARFGNAIADLGDIDGDGYRDIAISAPWENNGSGAVYIYRGDKLGVKNQYVQRIVASEARNFGIAIAKGHDVDENQCNDLAIGAHATGSAYVYRCIPTLTVHATIKIDQALDLPQNATNFTAEFCIYVAPQHNWSHSYIDLKAIIIVDPEANRAMISGDSEYTYKARPGISKCEEQVVKVKPTADLSRPISIKFDVEPIEVMPKNSTTFTTEAVRLSDDSTLHSEFDIQLTRDCGEDLICKPWLDVTLETMSDPYVPGADNKLGAIITVLNKEEPAYGVRVYLILPTQPKRVPNNCNLQGLNMSCDVVSPLYRNQSKSFEVEIEYTQTTFEEDMLVIYASIEDPLNRTVSDDPTQELELNIFPEANISVSGKALPNATVPVTREKLSTGSLIPFVHYFEVTNTGPSDWPLLDASIILPEKVSLSKPKEGCVEDVNGIGNATVLECTWSISAKVSLPVVLPLRYDLKTNGKLLEEASERNITTILHLYEHNKTISITTRLVLSPVSPLWPLIVGIVTGLLLLAAIAYGLYKYGFFSRNRIPDFNKLQEQVAQEDPGSSNSPPSTPPESMLPNDSTQELLYESDSD